MTPKATIQPPPAQKPDSHPKAKEKGRKLTWKEERELESMEGKIAETETIIENIEKTFMAPDFYEKHGAESAELQCELDNTKMKLNVLYERWEELENLKDKT